MAVPGSKILPERKVSRKKLTAQTRYNAVYALIRRLRYKYKRDGNQKADRQLDSVLWYSVPVVYTDYESGIKRAAVEHEKFRKRKYRYFRYCAEMVETFADSELCLFTLTFDDSIETTTPRTRKRYATAYLNSVCDDYIACVDYGKENGREHYHAVGVLRQNVAFERQKHGRSVYILPTVQPWGKGFYTIKPIRNASQTAEKSLRYALKACRYSCKAEDLDDAVKPFHKRGVEHWRKLSSDEELPF